MHHAVRTAGTVVHVVVVHQLRFGIDQVLGP